MTALQCPGCAAPGELRVLETRSTAAMVLRSRRCQACGEKLVTCEMVMVDGFIPKAIRRATNQGVSA